MYSIFQQLLKEYHITPYQVSKETGVTQTVLSNWKTGKSTPSNQNLQKIANYFNVSVDYLMTGKYNPNNPFHVSPRPNIDHDNLSTEIKKNKVKKSTKHFLKIIETFYGHVVYIEENSSNNPDHLNYYIIGEDKNTFILYENDIEALYEATLASLSIIIERLKKPNNF